jgi:hypothetical protein
MLLEVHHTQDVHLEELEKGEKIIKEQRNLTKASHPNHLQQED